MLEMFDKLDDIVYEPIKLVCEALRQPLKNSDAKLQAKLANDATVLATEMELRRKQRETEIELFARQKQAEIESQIADDQLARNARIVEEYKKFHIEMAEAGKNLLESIGHMQFSLREKAQEMCLAKTKEYAALQQEATKQMMADFKEISENFPENCPEKTIMLDVIKEQRQMITDAAKNFIAGLNNDMAQLNQHFNTLAEKSVDMTQQMLAPMRTQEISGKLQQSPVREIKLLK